MALTQFILAELNTSAQNATCGVFGAKLSARGVLGTLAANLRKAVSLRTVISLALLTSFSMAQAGNQQYEPLSDSVRSALAAAIHDTSAPEPKFKSSLDKVNWLENKSQLLKKKLPDYQTRIEFLKTLHYEAQRAGVPPELMLGLIQVESNFKKYAVSPVGARGLTQVMPFWTRVIGDGKPQILFNQRVNLRYGCLILRHYLDKEKGDVFRALGRYNGSLGRAEYPNAVLGAAQRFGYLAV